MNANARASEPDLGTDFSIWLKRLRRHEVAEQIPGTSIVLIVSVTGLLGPA
jgi:hypothetical protein